jgi:carbonic anhydrase/SulP family sulfate permease
MEYACVVAGAKLVVVMGHTSCGAVNAAVDLITSQKKASEATGCDNIDGLILELQQAIDLSTCKKPDQWLPGEKAAYANEVSRRNVLQTILNIRKRSKSLEALIQKGQIDIVGSLYDVSTGEVTFLNVKSLDAAPAHA